MERNPATEEYVCDGCGDTFTRHDTEPYLSATDVPGTFHSVECYDAMATIGESRHTSPPEIRAAHERAPSV